MAGTMSLDDFNAPAGGATTTTAQPSTSTSGSAPKTMSLDDFNAPAPPPPQQPALPPVSEFGDLGNQWWNTQAQPPPGGQPPPAPAPDLPTAAVGPHTPGYVHSDILPLARQESVVNDPNSKWYQGWALGPGPLRAFGMQPSELVTIDPETGHLAAAPEAQTAATLALRPGPEFIERPSAPAPPPRLTYDPAAPPGPGSPQFADVPPPKAAPPEDMPTITVTSKPGTTYQAHPDGTTTRTETSGPNPGPQTRSDRTLYLPPEDADKLGTVQTEGGPAHVIAPLGDGRWGAKYAEGPNTGKFDPRTVVTPKDAPEPGLTPVELWNGGRTVHYGHDITEVRTTPPEPPPTGPKRGETVDTAPPPPAPPPVPAAPLREPRFAGAGEFPEPPPEATTWTAERAKVAASNWYDLADQHGGTLQPSLVNRYLNYISNMGQRTRLGSVSGRYVPGAQDFTNLVSDLRAEGNRPWSLQEIQELDEDLGDMIDADYRNNRGLTKAGRNLLDAQQTLREMIENAGPGEIGGGSAGFEALSNARKAYSQAMKLSDLERMEARARMTDDFHASFRSQVNQLLGNTKRSRGYSTEERAALTRAAKDGMPDLARHMLGHPLELAVSLLAEHHTGGFTGGLAGYGAVRGVRAASAWASRRAQTKRLENVRGVVGGSIPSPPTSTAPPP